jgi:hypothetical protein
MASPVAINDRVFVYPAIDNKKEVKHEIGFDCLGNHDRSWVG